MKGYVFIYGVDGFGEDTSPAYEEGVYLDYEKAFNHLVKLNKKAINNKDNEFYENGYDPENGEYPESDTEMNALMEAYENSVYNAEENRIKIEKLFEKHILTDPEKICERFVNNEQPPFGFYSMVEVDVIS